MSFPRFRVRARSEPLLPEPARGALRAAINAVEYRILAPLLVGLGGLYFVFSFVHPFTLPPGHAAIMSAVAAASCAALWTLAYYTRRVEPTSERVHHVAALGAGLAVVNCILHLYLTGEPRQSTNLLLVIMAAGYLFLSTRWYAVVLLGTLAAWAAVVVLRPAPGEWFHYSLAIAEASVISIVIHLLRLQTTVRAERLRLKETRHLAELEAAKEKAEEMVQLKSSFLANMSHEIRTPLTSILGFAEILHDETTGEYRELSGLIHGSGLRLLDTLNSVLDLARLESGRMTLQTEAVDVAAAAADAVAYLEPLALKKGLYLALDLRTAPAWAQLDPAALARMLNNLIGNAIKFTEQGGVTVTVDVVETRVEARVRDTGVGISTAFLPYLFDEFRQESSGMARSHEGSGLGLSITRRLVEMQGGAIRVETVKGEGSTFILSFPRATPLGEIRNPDSEILNEEASR